MKRFAQHPPKRSTLAGHVAAFLSCLMALLLWPLSDGSSATQLDDSVVPYKLGAFGIDVSASSLKVYALEAPGRAIWSRTPEPSWLTVGHVTLTIRERQGAYRFRSAASTDCQALAVPPTVSASAAQMTLSWLLTGEGSCSGAHVTMVLTPVNDHRLAFKIASDDPTANYLALTGASTADETFHGFGLQPTYLNLKGHVVPIWTQEQGITRGLEPYSSLVNVASPGASGTAVTSYMTAPYYLTNKGSALFLKNSEYIEIDLGVASQAQIRLFAPVMEGEFLAGNTPLELVSTFTEYAGRMRSVPDWFHQGAIVGMQGGTAKVRAVWSKLQALGTPLAAFWLQDWVGRRKTKIGSQLWWNWELDTDHYPDWPQLLATLRMKGVRVLGYLNPHLVDVVAQGKRNTRRNLYREALANGYLVKNSKGAAYPVRLTMFKTGMVDFSNPEARTWFKAVIKDHLLGVGLSGWMCDFSEALPADAVTASGVSGTSYHNRYPEEWERINREAAAEAGVDEDTVSFCRAGYTQSPGAARFFWQGDQMVSWDRFDGLRSAVTGLIGGGLSGYSLNHSDIGGYTDLKLGSLRGLTRDHELLSRWEEFSAFTPAFRTHEGSQPEANAQIFDDEASYRSFDRNARLFASLFFYRKRLFAEAEAFGYPVVRALFLHYPDDPLAYQISGEFLLGQDILVAPVVEKNARQRTVYLPAGQWVHVWTGTTYGRPEGAVSINIPAPLGQPPAFYRAGSAVGTQWAGHLKSAGLLPQD